MPDIAAMRRFGAAAVPVAIALAAAACGAARAGAPVPRPFPVPSGIAGEARPGAGPPPAARRSGVDFPRYLAQVEAVETGGDCLARPAAGSALGCYQMTHAALVDAGLKDAGGGWVDNPWGVGSDDEFRRSRRAQDGAMLRYTARNWLRLEPCVRDLVGRTVAGVALDQAALVAGAHLLGATGVVRFVRCGLHVRCIPSWAAAGNGGSRNLHASALRRMRAARGLRVLAPAAPRGARCRLADRGSAP